MKLEQDKDLWKFTSLYLIMSELCLDGPRLGFKSNEVIKQVSKTMYWCGLLQYINVR